MPKKKVVPRGKTKILAEWRARHFEELEATLQVLRSIRDCETASNKDKIEASKSLGRLLGALQPEKVPEFKSKDITFESVKPKISDSLREKLERLKKNGMDTPNTEVL